MHGGDQLARGARKAQFPPAGSATTQEKWDAMFEGFDAEKYSRDADAEKNGNVGVGVGETSKPVRR